MTLELAAPPRMVTLKDLGRWRGGGTPSKSSPAFWTGGTIPWVSPKDMKTFRVTASADLITPEAVDSSAASLVSGPSVAVVTRSGILQRTLPVAVIPMDATFNQDMKVLQPNADVLPEYVAYYLRGHERDILGTCSKHGTTVASIDFARLQAYPIPLPPLDEQKQIVNELETQLARLDDAVASLQRARTRLKRYRASVLKAACEGRLVPTEAELARQESRDYEPASVLLDRIRAERDVSGSGKRRRGSMTPPLDTTNRPELPEGWVWTTLGDISDISGGIQKQPKRAPKDNAYPFLRVANVLRGSLDLSEIHRMELFDGELDKLRLETGDLLIVEGNGSRDQIGRMAIWNGSVDDCVHQNHIIRARLGSEVLPKYVESYWNSPQGNLNVMLVAASTSGLYTLSVSKVSQLPVPIPPVAEQKRVEKEVERRVSVIENLEETIVTSCKRAEALRQSVLRKAFRADRQSRHESVEGDLTEWH